MTPLASTSLCRVMRLQIPQIFFHVENVEFHTAAQLLGRYGKSPLAEAVSDCLCADAQILAKLFDVQQPLFHSLLPGPFLPPMTVGYADRQTQFFINVYRCPR